MKIKNAVKAMKDNRGVSLVELICSIAIFGIVAAAAISMVVFATRTNADISVDTIENIKVISTFDLIKRQIREAQSVEVEYSVENEKNKLEAIKLGDNGRYTLNEGRFVFSSDTSETVLMEGVTNVHIVSAIDDLSDQDTVVTVKYLSLLFEFESGETKQLTVSCRNNI